MGNVKLTLQYDGTGFSGFAPQPGKRSVRQEIEKALRKLAGKHISIVGASRTDAGVHALGQVCSFPLRTKIPVDRIPAALNALLPEDIRILKAEVKNKFNARFDAKSKVYEYLIYNSKPLPVHLRNLAWQVKPKLNLAAMRKAAKLLIGKHDFSSFCAGGSSHKSFVRTIKKLEIRNSKFKIGESCKLLVVSCKLAGDAFLYKMVRNIIGTLAEVGMGKRKAADMERILAAKDRKLAGRTAPPQGLCLIRVDY